MILTYSAKESFVADILEGRKIHTIREDKNNRWKPGMTIQHWWRNPRNKHLNPYRFLENKCTGVDIIEVLPGNLNSKESFDWIDVKINNVSLTNLQKVGLAYNDGLTFQEFSNYFFLDLPIGQYFTGKIIHWTDFRY